MALVHSNVDLPSSSLHRVIKVTLLFKYMYCLTEATTDLVEWYLLDSAYYISCNLTFIYLFGVLHRFQHCTGHITMGSWKGRGNQYIQFVRDLYCKLPTNGKQLPAFPT